MAKRLRGTQSVARRAALTRAAVGMLAILVVGAGVLWRLAPSAAAGGITCAQCQAGFDSLHRQVDLGEPAVPSEMTAALFAHLEQCEHCRQKFRELYPQSNVLLRLSVLPAESAPSRFVAAAF